MEVKRLILFGIRKPSQDCGSNTQSNKVIEWDFFVKFKRAHNCYVCGLFFLDIFMAVSILNNTAYKFTSSDKKCSLVSSSNERVITVPLNT